MKENIVGVDVGGTKINFGVVNDGKVIRTLKIKTPVNECKEMIVQMIIAGIEKVTNGLDFKGIGMGVPGLLDEKRGIVYRVNNIPSWDEVHLKDSLSNHFSKETHLTNDANCYALGEKLYGKGLPYQNMVGVTLGTGLGAGIILNNKLHSGLFSCAGELGSIPYKDHNFEYYCCGQYFKNVYQVSGKQLFAHARSGDKAALHIYKDFGKNIGELIKIILHFISPEAIFFGGSIVDANPYFHDSLMESVNEFPYEMVKNKLVIDYSEMSDIAVLGSAGLFQFRTGTATEEIKLARS